MKMKGLAKILLAGTLALAGCSDSSSSNNDSEPANVGHAPVWQTLSSQKILRGSAEGTIVYKDIKKKCTDPDDPTGKYPLEYYIMNSWTPNYEVFFEGNDLVVKNLNPNYTGARDIILRASDNNDPTGFHQSDVSFTLIVNPGYSRDETNKNLLQDEGGIIRSWWSTDYDSDAMEQTLLKMHDMGLESITLMTTYYQGNKNSTSISVDAQKTPNESGLEKVIKRSKELGFKIRLKPHVDLYSGEWRGEISFDNESDWMAWFGSYESYINHMAEFAEKNKVDMLVIGTELDGTSHRQEWHDLISGIKSVYSGKLTYSANWDSYDKPIFWNDLDFIGISEYPPIASDFNPSPEELAIKSELRAQEIDDFANAMGKQVLLTEMAFHDRDGTGTRPNELTSSVVDHPEQAECYYARLKTLLNRPSIAGIDLYSFYYDSSKNPDGFTVTGTLAEDAISYWFHYDD
jgi:hypothetical protein